MTNKLIGIGVTANTRLAKDAPDSFKRITEEAVQEVMEAGEQRLDERFRPRPGGVYLSVAQAQRNKASTGHYRRFINGVRRGLNAIIKDGFPGVIYGPWLEGTSTRNQVSRFKGYFVWRDTRQWLQAEANRIARKKVRKWIRMVSG
tara:strand:+ start:346 stop:783 length:438 start_codon:yes stop_codon:yes gene_type:complete